MVIQLTKHFVTRSFRLQDRLYHAAIHANRGAGCRYLCSWHTTDIISASLDGNSVNEAFRDSEFSSTGSLVPRRHPRESRRRLSPKQADCIDTRSYWRLHRSPQNASEAKKGEPS